MTKMNNGHENRARLSAKPRAASAFIIAGTNSGVGKTVITLGIMEALRRRKIAVRPFKAGPDYIDAGLHSALLKRPSYNLDTWMMGAANVKKTFYSEAAAEAGISVIEGVMGLFDGRDGLSDEGSTAHLAKLLNIPVVLVVNAEKTARSAAAVVHGFKGFDRVVDVKWVVFNRVAGVRHSMILKESIKGIRGVKCLGCIPKDGGLALPERHLGLFSRGELKGNVWHDFIKKAGEAIERHLDIEALLKPFLKRKAKAKREKARRAPHHGERVRIAVARDIAFSFYYEENLAILRGLGGELIFFSSLRDRRLPDG
ncbi:MAG: cobyrinate a,c-diamide synthase, partial [Deltaproteobacteria bacterium]|nr:cobyrinate a,c-diamide synthase [Deltaproteobacteria bacterium]